MLLAGLLQLIRYDFSTMFTSATSYHGLLSPKRLNKPWRTHFLRWSWPGCLVWTRVRLSLFILAQKETNSGRTKSMFSAVGSDRGQFVFKAEANRVKVCLEEDRGHLKN
ncbi:hypothetical protein AMECASPLE_006489 [Ameca splendens]|uniref:Uncharacterized protein n=1 Tax=Ameca splendens TaxID=208324 RepID=A0ABV1A6J8_9TELE